MRGDPPRDDPGLPAGMGTTVGPAGRWPVANCAHGAPAGAATRPWRTCLGRDSVVSPRKSTDAIPLSSAPQKYKKPDAARDLLAGHPRQSGCPYDPRMRDLHTGPATFHPYLTIGLVFSSAVKDGTRLVHRQRCVSVGLCSGARLGCRALRRSSGVATQPSESDLGPRLPSACARFLSVLIDLGPRGEGRRLGPSRRGVAPTSDGFSSTGDGGPGPFQPGRSG